MAENGKESEVDRKAEKIIQILRQRDQQPTQVLLGDGSRLLVFNIAWGIDMGDTHYHVTTNISPAIESCAIDFFFTNEVVALVDPETAIEIFTIAH